MSVEKINNLALQIHTDPRIIVGSMNYGEFSNWISNEPKYVLENLMNILIDYEMYEYCAVVKKEIEKIPL